MTRPGIEPRSPGPLENTLPTRPMSGFERISIIIRLSKEYVKSSDYLQNITNCLITIGIHIIIE